MIVLGWLSQGMKFYGLIEGGGTKIVVAVAASSGDIIARHRVPTTEPAETLQACSRWFRAQDMTLEAIGIAFFGPLDLDPNSSTWGRITRTTKPHWSEVDVAGHFAADFDCPIAIETDVDGAAIGELTWGAGRGHSSLLYVTIGTGIGGGFASKAGLLRGLSHPEMGHIRSPRHRDDSDFPGICPFHGDCLEGLASGPAIIARWGKSLSELPSDHEAHDMIGWYLGQAVCSFQAIMEPAAIVLGGGVMQTSGLLETVRATARYAGGGYFVGDPGTIVVRPGLGDNSALLGALSIAKKASAAR